MLIGALDLLEFSVIMFIVALVFSGLSVYHKPRDSGRLYRIEAKVDLLLKQAGLVYDPSGGLPPGVLDALQQGKKIEAIKLYREATGVGLAEAKASVEEVQASLKLG